MTELVFPAESLSLLRDELLRESPNEAAAVLLAGSSRSGSRLRVLARESIKVPSDAYLRQSPTSIELSPLFLAPLIKRARSESLSILLAHTHPFARESVGFSTVDDAGEQTLMPTLFQRAPNGTHGSIVLGIESQAARVWTTPVASQSADRMVEAGGSIRVHTNGPQQEWESAKAFDRNVRAFGRSGQRLLERLHYGIVGLGGTGSHVAQQIAHLGAKQVTLIDPDVIDESNLNRLIGAAPQLVGMQKVEVAAAQMKRISPSVHVATVVGDVRLLKDSARLLGTDMIFCCTDSHGSRAVLNQIAYQHMIPVIDMGVRIDATEGVVSAISGRAQMLAPGLPCLVCTSFLNPEEVRRDFLDDADRAKDQYIVGSAEPQPAVVSLNGTVSSLAVTMMLAAVTGLPSAARHQVMIGRDGVIRAVAGECRSGCPVCSLNGAFGRGDAWSLMGKPA